MPGLLAVLGLVATCLIAAATTCFMLYIKPVMQVSIRAAALSCCCQSPMPSYMLCFSLQLYFAVSMST
jgi:hypothetical protein